MATKKEALNRIDKCIRELNQPESSLHAMLKELKSCVNSIYKEKTHYYIKPTRLCVGDVIMRNHIGHPVILLRPTINGWICGILSTKKDHALPNTEFTTRFYEGSSYLTGIVMLKDDENTLNYFMYSLEDKEVTDKLLKSISQFKNNNL